jgi:hypothetical protein
MGAVIGATGRGLIVIVKLAGLPGQVALPTWLIGVIVIVAVIGVLPGLVAVKDGMLLPDPLAARPIAVLLFVQSKEVVLAPVNGITGVVTL